MPALLLLAILSAQAEEPRTLALDEALAIFAERNPSLLQARARAEAARGGVGQAAAAALPVVVASGSYVRNSEEAIVSLNAVFDGIEEAISAVAPRPVELDRSGVPADLIIQPLESWTATGTLRLPLLAPAAWADIGAARKGAEGAALSADALALQIEAGFVSAAWQVAAAEEVVRAAEQALESARAHHEAVKERLEAGLATPLDALSAEADLLRQEADFVEARAGLDRARLALGALLGQEGPVRIEMLDPAATLAESEPSVLLERARSARPEIDAARAQAAAARRQLLGARLRHLPVLSASGTALASDTPFPTGEKTAWRLGLDATWTLYDGGFRYGRARQARGEQAAAEAAATQATLQASLEVRQALADVEVARERLELARRQLALAEEARAAAERSYQQGLVSELAVRDALDRALLAKVGLARARAGLGTADARLRAAVGGG